jgi:hypothetical protein
MTTRRVLFGASALVVTLAIGASWLIWRRSGPPAAHPGLTLLVNLHPHVEITPGTPLLFEVSVGSSPSAPGFDIGSRWRPWHSLVRLEPADGSAIPWRTAQAGVPRSVHMRRAADGSPEVTEDAPVVAHLEAGRDVHIVTFAARPGDTASIKPGTYGLRAVLQTPWWLRWGWTGRAVSGAVTVLVRDPSQADDRTQALEAERLARTADFYVNVGQYAEAHKAAISLVASRPKESRSHILVGDALAGLDRRQEALDAYRRAMALLPRSYEEPTLLTERIRKLVETHTGANRQQVSP